MVYLPLLFQKAVQTLSISGYYADLWYFLLRLIFVFYFSYLPHVTFNESNVELSETGRTSQDNQSFPLNSTI